MHELIDSGIHFLILDVSRSFVPFVRRSGRPPFVFPAYVHVRGHHAAQSLCTMSMSSQSLGADVEMRCAQSLEAGGGADAARERHELGCVIAFDMSGSTRNVAHYHDTASEVVAATAAGGEGVQYILWESNARWATPAELADVVARRHGDHGTDPSAFVRLLAASGVTYVAHLVLITDGEVDVSAVDEADGALAAARISFGRVSAHLIGPRSMVNMSVSAPFTRACESSVTVYDPVAAAPALEFALSAEDVASLALISSLGDLPGFEAARPALERAVAAHCVGRGTQEALRSQLLALRGRLSASLAAAAGETAAEPRKAFLGALLGARDADAAASALAAFHESWVAAATAGPGPLKAVDELISMASGALRVAFNAGAISSVKARAAPLVDAVDMEEVNVDGGAGASAGPFSCPITLDDDETPALLLRAPGPGGLMAGRDAALTKRVLACPLAVLRCPALLAAVGELLDTAISCRALRDAERAGAAFRESPMTRSPLAGAVPLGSDASHARAADAALAAAFTGGHKAGSADLWFAVLRAAVAATPRLAELRPFVDAQMVWRLQHRYAAPGLGGGAAAFTPRLPLGAAIWATLHLGAAVPALPPSDDPLRARAFDAAALRELCALAPGVPGPGAGGSDRLAATAVLLNLLGAAHRCERRLRIDVRALTQHAVRVDRGEIRIPALRAAAPARVLLDGAPAAGPAAADGVPPAGMPRVWGTVPLALLLGLAARVSTGASSGALVLTPEDVRSLGATPLPPAVVSWPAYARLRDGAPPPVPRICPATMRPYAAGGDAAGAAWHVAAAAALGAVAAASPAKPADAAALGAVAAASPANPADAAARRELFPVCRFFAEFVVAHGAYPNATELLVYAAERSAARGRETLPACAPSLAAAIVRAFGDAGASSDGDVAPREFASRYHRSTQLGERAAMEAAPPAPPAAARSARAAGDARRGRGGSGGHGRDAAGLKRGRSNPGRGALPAQRGRRR